MGLIREDFLEEWLFLEQLECRPELIPQLFPFLGREFKCFLRERGKLEETFASGGSPLPADLVH